MKLLRGTRHHASCRRRYGRLGLGRAMLVLVLVLLGGPAVAGPPFLTDDPEPIDYGHWEFYTFSTLDRTGDGTGLQVPAFELNYGFAPNFMAHLVVPFALADPLEGPTTYGIGDAEIGLKFRFLQESSTRPMIGVFPMLEVSTGDAERGLGNGETWVKLPLWIQKSWGEEGREWTTYGGGGYALNNAAGQRDCPFGGWLLQKALGSTLTLGGELFAQGRSTDDGRAWLIADFGGYYSFSDDFSLLFTVGHTITGERHLIGYLGLYWTW
jgi:hypothetical protein